MNKSALVDEAIALVSDALGLSAGRLDATARLNSVPEWDSLGQLGIVTEFEERTSTEVSEARTFARLCSVTSIASMLAAKNADKVIIPGADGHPGTPASFYRPAVATASLVLVHGISADRHEWGFFDLLSMEALDRNIAVLAIDYQGHGQSVVPIGNLSLRGIVKEIESSVGWLREQLPSPPTMILGNSFGAGVGLIAGVATDVSLVGMTCAVTNYLADLRRINPELIVSPDGGIQYSSLSLPQSLISEMSEIDTRLADVRPTFPVLFVHGEDDSDVPCSEAREFASALPRQQFISFNGMDHTFTAPRGHKQRDEATVYNREVAALRIAKELDTHVKLVRDI